MGTLLRCDHIKRDILNDNGWTIGSQDYYFGRMYVKINKNESADNSIVRVGEYDIHTKFFIPFKKINNIFNFNRNTHAEWSYWLAEIFGVGFDEGECWRYNFDSMIGIPYTSTIIYFNGKSFNWYNNTLDHSDSYTMAISDKLFFDADDLSDSNKNKLNDTAYNSLNFRDGYYSNGQRDLNSKIPDIVDAEHTWDGDGVYYKLYKPGTTTFAESNIIRNVFADIRMSFGTKYKNNDYEDGKIINPFAIDDGEYNPHDFINCGYNYLKCVY